MNGKPCASSNKVQSWESIDWAKARAYVKKLQMRIVKAQKEGHYSKVKSLQWLLTHSFYAKALAVKRVTSNRGKRTAGVDHELWLTPQAKFKAISKLNRRGYTPKPLRRHYIPKKNGKMRPLGIPTMTDRAMQTLYKFAVVPHCGRGKKHAERPGQMHPLRHVPRHRQNRNPGPNARQKHAF